ncbi:hypothetical protein M431DRAFT_486977 [Trichoderma harzianum CBS 226.95]|uniref:Uncharacterized protein n=1 Tax=Trichoderma harzianum CBS 226.95 TaxID=983964 RepID=A0A2T3ZW73_TRIHA|nr:hypothetical protein M431DRAFT_486977 [Trichoderma harzianum CBS 226.95]PTB49065.1 hypothetical protein M431DRAFT_486977 [Trichoderma harzianum CBS 226.95]
MFLSQWTVKYEQIGSNYIYRPANWDPDIDSFFPLSVHYQTDTLQFVEYIEIPSFTCLSQHQRMYAIQPAVEDYQTNNFICRNRLAIRKGIDGARLHTRIALAGKPPTIGRRRFFGALSRATPPGTGNAFVADPVASVGSARPSQRAQRVGLACDSWLKAKVLEGVWGNTLRWALLRGKETHKGALCLCVCLGNLVKLRRAGDRALQLLLFNEESLVSASHQLALITVPALCTHRPSLLPIEWLSEASGLAQRGGQLPLRAGKLMSPNSVI